MREGCFLSKLSIITNSPIALCSERDRENLLKEVGKMASLEHKNVMTLIGVCLDGEMPLIIMPFMTKGSVLEYVRNMKENPLQVITFLSTRHFNYVLSDYTNYRNSK